MKKFGNSFLALLMLGALSVRGAVVDTLAVYSKAMKKNIEVIVITPQSPRSTPYPVVYMLHGHGNNARCWITLKPELKDVADRDGLIFVCPDGADSWYWDSPKDSSYRYETFVSAELVAYVDSRYPTVKDRSARAITGLSMGGHGALWLAFRHKDVFGAVGSTSGGVDIRPFPGNWGMSRLLGSESENRDVWEQHTVINQIDRIRNGELAIIVDCGYSDFFFEVNNDFHQKLLKYKINHDFLVRPGAHNGDYWKNSMDYHILFFKKFFRKGQGRK